jgi:hypothetical protein
MQAWRVIGGLVIVAGCGTDEHTPAAVSDCAALDAVKELGKLARAMTATDGPSGFAAAETLFQDAKDMFGAGCSADPTPPDNATCTPERCTFQLDREIYPSITKFGGTVTRDGDAVTLALEAYNGHSPTLGATWTIDGTLRLTEAIVDGQVRARAVVTGNFPTPGTYETTIDFRSIAVDEAGCPTEGSMYAVDIANVTVDYGDPSHDIAGTARFGPACGQVQ